MGHNTQPEPLAIHAVDVANLPYAWILHETYYIYGDMMTNSRSQFSRDPFKKC